MEQRQKNAVQKTETADDIASLYRKYGQRFRFPVYTGEEFMTTPIEELELSVRSYNCLRRAGLNTVGDIVENVDTRDDLLRIRNLGRRSADEIMDGILRYQYSILPKERRGKYLRRIEEINTKTEI